MASLLAMLDGKLDAARRLRLARDSWSARVDAWRRYNAALAEPLALMRLSRDALDQIRRLAGPSPPSLGRLAARAPRARPPQAAPGPPRPSPAPPGRLRHAIHLAH